VDENVDLEQGPVTKNDDEAYMLEALKQAEAALSSKDEPVGAVIVSGSRIVARAHHQVKLLKDPTAHAAIIAITQAASSLNTAQLNKAVLYVTQEPGVMDLGAIFLSGVARLVYGAADSKYGACGSVVDLTSNERLNRKMSVTRGVLASECHTILRKAASGATI